MTDRGSLLHRIWHHRHFYLFISPFFILFGIFGLYPLVFSFYLAFVKWDGLTEIQWVGLANLIALCDDDMFFKALWNTLVIGVLHIPPMLLGAFLFALLLNASWIRGRGLFRAAIFMPVITPMVAIAVVFSVLYSTEAGLLNYLLARLGIPGVPWLVSEEWSKPAIAIMLVWRWTGYNMLIMLAGLQGINDEFYEAAKVDGANACQAMWHVTLPQMRPIFIFCAIMSLLGTFFMFDEVFVLTSGGPGSSSTNIGLYLFNQAFSDFKFGYASCVAYVVAIGVFIVSLVILRMRDPDTE